MSVASDLRFDAVDLIGRTGSHRHVERTVAAGAPESDAVAMSVPEGGELAVEAELESVVEGIYVHGTVTARLQGECSRCLDPVEQDVVARVDELFLYPEKVKAADREDSVLLEGDEVDLGPLVRDGLAMEAEERPLCREDCPGLCPQCGFRMEDDPEHGHDVTDPRFAALEGFFDAGEER
ncbi:YceD family protein [Brachybacterium sp. J153]|uniref:YceD family protein n=1 Tax=Brachybacterium sp. J153 TaxID=3116488 RepID=UPI002E78C0E4|nr:YceD family protein [Brachybacterium sp. J153]MEE1617173.1 YceD family protein [Brachybacterium sp. J153]